MRCNIGQIEKLVRGLIALPVIAYGHYYQHYNAQWGEVIFWTGMYIALTALFAWCPMRRIARFFSRAPDQPTA